MGWKNQTMGYNGTIMVNVLKSIQSHNCKGFPCNSENRCSDSHKQRTYVFSGEHLEQLLLRAGFCLDPWHLMANLSSSAISKQIGRWKHFFFSQIKFIISNSKTNLNTNSDDRFGNFSWNSNKIPKLLQ